MTPAGAKTTRTSTAFGRPANRADEYQFPDRQHRHRNDLADLERASLGVIRNFR